MITLRPATDEDLPALLRLIDVVHEWHAEHYPHHFRATLEPEAVTDFFREMLADDACDIDLAMWEDTAAGYMLTRFVEDAGGVFTHPLRSLHVEHVAVAKDQRRKGIAGTLLQRAFERAKALGGYEVKLYTWAANANAHKSFEAAGLAQAGHWFARKVTPA